MAPYQQFIDRLGDWNPQLLREFRGNLKRSSVVIVIGLSLVLQIAIFGLFSVGLPGAVQPDQLRLGTYPDIEINSVPSPRAAAVPVSSLAIVQSVFKEITVESAQPLSTDDADAVLPGDHLLTIDGQAMPSTTGDFSGLIQAIRGSSDPYSIGEEYVNRDQIGTWVELSLWREGRGEFAVKLPRVVVADYQSSYCRLGGSHIPGVYYPNRCAVTADAKAYAVDWVHWYETLFVVMGGVLIFAVMGLGTILLIGNLDQERRRGTLNFVRLSPRSSGNILLGQLLGVPSCLYLGVAIALPAHIYTGLQGGLSPIAIASFYAVLAIQTLVFYSAALLLGLVNVGLGSFQAWLGSGLVIGFQWFMLLIAHTSVTVPSPNAVFGTYLLTPFFSLRQLVPQAFSNNYAYDPGVELQSPPVIWFLGHTVGPLEYPLLVAINGFVLTACLWQALHRRYNNTQGTILSRRYSYGLTCGLVAMMLGFAVGSGTNLDQASRVITDNGITLTLMITVYFLGLLVALTPTRQTLQDWARFRQSRVAETHRKSLWRDLVFGDTSSPLLALVINLGIAFGLVFAWVLVTPLALTPAMGLSLLSCMGILLIYGLLSQIITLSRVKKTGVWAGGTIMLSFLLPGMLVAVLGGIENRFPGLSLATFPWIMFEGVSASAAFALLGQWIAIAAMTGIYVRQLHQAGESASKALMNNSLRRLKAQP